MFVGHDIHKLLLPVKRDIAGHPVLDTNCLDLRIWSLKRKYEPYQLGSLQTFGIAEQNIWCLVKSLN